MGFWALQTTAIAAGLAVVLTGGCNRDVRLDDQKVRSVTVRSVTLYGVTLGEQASPEQVAFAVLRAIREDFEATTAKEREAALDKQFDLCAANEIQAKNHGSLERDPFVHNVVFRWTPTVSHYVGDFETEWDKAEPRLIRRTAAPTKNAKTGAPEIEIAMEVVDPSGDANARVVMSIWMAKDKGFWRVLHLGFDPKIRSLKTTDASKILPVEVDSADPG